MEKVKEVKEENERVIDFSGVPLLLLRKMKNAPKECLNPTLIELSKNNLFEDYPNKFDLLLSQTNPESQQIIFDALNSHLFVNRHCFDYLVYLKDNPEKQRRVIEYTEIPSIIYNEFFTLAMVSIEDDGLEKSLRQKFKEDLINNSHDFIYYKDQYYKSLNLKNNIMHLFI